LTKAMEALKGTAEGEAAHAAQHDLLYQVQRQTNKEKCANLLAKVPGLERKIEQLKQPDKSFEAEKLEVKRDEIIAITRVHCNFID